MSTGRYRSRPEASSRDEVRQLAKCLRCARVVVFEPDELQVPFEELGHGREHGGDLGGPRLRVTRFTLLRRCVHVHTWNHMKSIDT